MSYVLKYSQVMFYNKDCVNKKGDIKIMFPCPSLYISNIYKHLQGVLAYRILISTLRDYVYCQRGLTQTSTDSGFMDTEKVVSDRNCYVMPEFF